MRRQRGLAVIAVLVIIAAVSAASFLLISTFATTISGTQQTGKATVSSSILGLASDVIASELTFDAKNNPVPTPFLVATPAPAGGGQIYATSAAPKIDAWGTAIGYCTNTPSTQGDPVYAVVSAGSDQVFQTSCAQALAGVPFGDDAVEFKIVTDIRSGVGGSVYYGDPVASLSALEALTSVRPGEIRATTDTGYFYVNKSGTPGAGMWTLSGGGGTAPGATKICTAGYVAVPAFALPDGTFVDSFCVMQYEARNVAGIANSDVTVFGTQGPWVSITQTDAKTACNAAGANLIGENQWLSIAHQAVSVASNWSGGAVGSGTIARGWSASTATGDAWADTVAAPANDSSCLYNTGANTCGATGSILYRRTLILPNGNNVWDISGNIWEWSDALLNIGNEYMQSTIGWYAYNTVTGDIGTAALTPTQGPRNKLPPNNWNASQGMGRYYDLGTDRVNYPGAYNSVSQSPDSCTGYCAQYAAFVRGGNWNTGTGAGLFTLDEHYGRAASYTRIGFRCTR